MMRVFMTMLCSLLTVCFVSAQISRQEGTDGQAAIYRLSLFERAVRCTKYFEGWHSEKHHPYVGWGHKILPGERYSARTMTKRQADALLRKDLRKFCAMFRQFGKDSLLLATLAYNVGPYRLLGSKTIPKSTLIKKLEAGDRNIYREYVAFCNYKGKRHAAQTEKGGVCTAVYPVTVNENPMKPPTSSDFPLFIHSGLYPYLSRHHPCKIRCFRV